MTKTVDWTTWESEGARAAKRGLPRKTSYHGDEGRAWERGWDSVPWEQRQRHGTADYTILGEPAEYPGHPVVNAYLITFVYPSLAVAKARGERFLAVEENGELPGAGGHNTHGLVILESLAHCFTQGKPVEDVWAVADNLWRSVDGQANGGYRADGRERLLQRFKNGQAQADRIKPLLYERAKTWLKAQ